MQPENTSPPFHPVPKEDACYWCGKPSVSSEHVPPKCLFPETKDIPEKNLRKDLFTVRSCEEHNQGKSNDDEFLFAVLAPIFGNNGIGFLHTQTKLRRALKRHQGALADATYRSPKDYIVETKSGHKFPTQLVQADTLRILRSLESVARGVFRLEFGYRFVGKCQVLPEFLDYQSGEVNGLRTLVKLLAAQESSGWPCRSTNPDVFSYQRGPTDQYGLTPLIMNFYRTARVFVAFCPEGITPPHKLP